MFSVMARRAAKSGLAAGQDEMGSSGSSREEKEMEQGEAGGDSRVRGGTARQTSGPRKSGVSGRGGDASEGGKTSERRDGGRAVAEEEGGKSVATPVNSGWGKEQDDSDEMETGAVPQLDGADNEGKRDKKESDKSSTGVKRGRGSTSGAPPTKTMQLNSGERVAGSGEGGKEEEGEDGEEEESEVEKKSSKQKQELQRRPSTHRPRTRSLSNSDSPVVGLNPTKTSPMTRSHSAVKKDVEFVSLPSTKKRKKGGGRWPKRDTPSPSPSLESTKAETPTKQQKPDPPAKVVEAAGKQQKTDPPTTTGTEEDVAETVPEETPPQPAQPPKRRRGRPPKHQRKDVVTPAPPSQPTKGKAAGSGPGVGSGSGRGRGKGRLSSGDSAGEKKSVGGKSKTEGETPKKKSNSEGKAESKGVDKSTKSVVKDDDSPTVEKSSVTPDESEAPLPEPRREQNTALKKKKKERRASGEDGKKTSSGGRAEKKAERLSKKSSSSEEDVSASVSKQGSKHAASNKADVSGAEEVSPEDDSSGGGKPGTSRPSVFVSVLSGPGKATMAAAAGDEDPAVKENMGEVTSHEATQSQDAGEETVPKPPHVVQNSFSPSLPYPTTTIPPFHPHTAYPYPGPYPPPLMFPGTSNPMYSPYYPGYPPLPPPPPTVSQPMPGAFIPTCPSDPLPPFSSTQPLTTMGGVQVSVLDKLPSQLPTTLSPHSPHSPTQHQSPGTHTVAMELARHYPQPHPLSQAYRPGVLPPGPAGGHYLPHNPYVSVRLDPTGIPFVDWGMPHSHLPPHHKVEDMNKLPPGKMEPKQEEVPIQSVECPECGRSFKNNKALNGHMRLHGGFDWTKKPFSTSHQQSSSASAHESSDTKPHPSNEDRSHAKKSVSKKHNHSRSRSHSPAPHSKRRCSSDASNGSDKDSDKRSGEPSVFTFDTSQMHPSHHIMPPPPLNTTDAGTMTARARGAMPAGPKGATLDDLCRAVEALEKMENGSSGGLNQHGKDSDEDDKRRPGNIHIPTHTSPSLDRDRHRFGSTPPYTPPPILSPARSMAMLAAPGTPSRILQPWSCRRSSDHRKPSEAEEGSYPEPKINVGRQFQAVLPPCDDRANGTAPQETLHHAEQVWKPPPHPLEEDESVIDGFLELACSPAIQHAGRNKEYALHILHSTGGSVKEAVRLLLTGKSVFPEDHPMATYHYSGSRQWSARERQQFRRAWRVHRKQFHLLKSAVEGKSLPEVTEYYYYWKKYCNDEYRGRNRHISEEIMSDEDLGCPQSHSSDSCSSSEVEATASSSSLPPPDVEKTADKQQRKARGEIGVMPRPQVAPLFDLPIVYAPHSSRVPRGIPVQQYKCKYPGCTQVFTSIFALNGHIRIHGGSFYPKSDKKDARSSSPSTAPSSSTPPNILPSSYPHHSTMPTIRAGSNGPVKHVRPTSSVAAEMRSAQHLEIARALLDLPQPRSPARGGTYHTPSPKPSPGSKRSPSGKKKMSSSSPGEHEGYYPCNRCGRVFTKVKSRSAHMKSHIMKPTHHTH